MSSSNESILHRVLQQSSVISKSVGMDHLGLESEDASAKSGRDTFPNFQIPRQRFYYAPSDRWAKMIQNEAYYCIGFLMKGDKISSNLCPTTREWAPLVSKITGMFAEYKIPTLEKLIMLSDQSILKGFVYDALEALREVESRQDEKEEVHGYADASYESPAASISDDQPAIVNVIAWIFEEAPEMPLGQNQECDSDENISTASTSCMSQDSSHDSLPELVASSSNKESNESADDDDEKLSHGKMSRKMAHSRSPNSSLPRAPRTDAQTRIEHEKGGDAVILWMKTWDCEKLVWQALGLANNGPYLASRQMESAEKHPNKLLQEIVVQIALEMSFDGSRIRPEVGLVRHVAREEAGRVVEYLLSNVALEISETDDAAAQELAVTRVLTHLVNSVYVCIKSSKEVKIT